MMMQVLDESARVRLANIAAVKPEKAEIVTSIIIGNLQKGAIKGKINESQLIDLLEQFADKMAEEEENAVTFNRKKAFDSDDDFDLDNLDL